jgi:hypothetical protein
MRDAKAADGFGRRKCLLRSAPVDARIRRRSVFEAALEQEVGALTKNTSALAAASRLWRIDRLRSSTHMK